MNVPQLEPGEGPVALGAQEAARLRLGPQGHARQGKGEREEEERERAAGHFGPRHFILAGKRSGAPPRREPGEPVEPEGDEAERAKARREGEALEGAPEDRAQEIRGEGVRGVLDPLEARGEDERGKRKGIA